MAPKKKKVAEQQESEEERAARLEALATAAKEAAVRREEAARQKLLDRQKHEEALTRLNAPKVHTEWRERMRGAKLVELRAEAERMQDAHTRTMHARNHALQALDVKLQEAEDLQLEAHSTHVQTLDRLVQLQRERIDAAVLMYEEDRKALAQDYEQKTQSIMQSYEAARAEEDIIQVAMHRHFAKCEAEQKLVYQTARAEAQNAASEEYNMLKISREAQIAALKKAIREEEHRHKQTTVDTVKEVEQLQKVDAEGRERLSRNIALIIELEREAAHWRSRAVLADQEWSERHQSLTAERAELQRQHSEMERSLKTFCKEQAAALQELCMVSAAQEAEVSRQLKESERQYLAENLGLA